MFKKGCFVALAVWVALMGAYGYVAWMRLHDRVAVIVIGLLGGTFSAILVSSIVGFFTGGRDRAAIRRAAAMEPRRDGRLEAASGPIQPIGAPLEAPFTGQPCVAYQYDIKPRSGGESDYAGFALTPCAIQTLHGPVKVLGVVMLDEFPAAPEQRIDRNRGVEYLSSAPLESVGLPGLVRAFGQLLADDDGAIRKDFRIHGNDVNLQGRLIKEQSLPVGSVVTLLGNWSEAQGGFPGGGATSMLRVFAGDLEYTRKRVGGDAKSTFFAALLFFVVLHAILVPIYFFAPAHPVSAESVWDERDCERQKAKLDAGSDPNTVGNDAITPLMNAARLSEPACVSQLLAAGARLEARDKWGDTALGEAVVAGRDDNVRVLLAAGAKDFRVTAATGRPITEGDAPVTAVKDYIAAVYAGDLEAMARLRAHASLAVLQDQRDNLPFWQSRLPKTFTIESGWMTSDAATLTIRGAVASGPPRIMFHLERATDMSHPVAEADTDSSGRGGDAAKAGVWRIRHEWRPDEH